MCDCGICQKFIGPRQPDTIQCDRGITCGPDKPCDSPALHCLKCGDYVTQPRVGGFYYSVRLQAAGPNPYPIERALHQHCRDGFPTEAVSAQKRWC